MFSKNDLLQQTKKKKQRTKLHVHCEKSPHGVKDSPVLHDAEELVGCGHVMGNGLLGVSEESVWRPDFVHHEVIQPQDFNGALEFQPLINPHLAEKHVHGVLLRHKCNIVLIQKNPTTTIPDSRMKFLSSSIHQHAQDRGDISIQSER